MITQNDQLVICGQGEQTRPYIYELDLLRAVTAVTVVAVHVLSGTTMLNHTQAGLQVQNGIFISVSVTRDVFMFITALALTYVYFGRPFSGKRFWAKRRFAIASRVHSTTRGHSSDVCTPAHQRISFAASRKNSG